MGFNVNDIVVIRDRNKYDGKLNNMVGIVSKTFFKSSVGLTYGIRVYGRKNEKSSDGCYWFDELALERKMTHTDFSIGNPFRDGLAAGLVHIQNDLEPMTPNQIYVNTDTAYAKWLHSQVESYRKTINDMLRKEMNMNNYIPGIKKVIYNGPKTIILWGDRTKTIVSCGEGQAWDPYYGFCAAVTKKVFGSKHQADKIVDKAVKDAEYRATINIIKNCPGCDICDNTDCLNTPDED